MRDSVKELLQNFMFFLVVITIIGGMIYGFTKPDNPPAVQQVEGGTVMQEGYCMWFVPKSGDDVILMSGSRDMCHGRDNPALIVR